MTATARAWIGGVVLALVLAAVAYALRVVGSAESERYLDSFLSGDADWYVTRAHQTLDRELIAVFRFTRVSAFALYCVITALASYGVSRWVLRAAVGAERVASLLVCIGLPTVLMIAGTAGVSLAIAVLAAAPLLVGGIGGWGWCVGWWRRVEG